MTHYKSIFLSDVHLGSRAAQAEPLCEFLKHNTCDTLYLVGDIIDLWKLNQHVFWPQSHSNVVRRVLTAAKRGTRVKYVIGNHDENFRHWFGHFQSLGNIELANSFDHELANGQRLLVTHGDLFDSVMLGHRWLSVLGDRAYASLLWTNHVLNRLRRSCGLGYWSLASFLKTRTKTAVAFVTDFENLLIRHAESTGYAGVICGHIHTPKLRVEPTGVVYVNTGDWCETISAVVEKFDGTLELLVWDRELKSLTCQAQWTPTA